MRGDAISEANVSYRGLKIDALEMLLLKPEIPCQSAIATQRAHPNQRSEQYVPAAEHLL